MFYIRGASFWQQEQVWRNRLDANQQNLDVITAVTAKMSTALTNLSGGMAGIANQQALARVKAQLKAAAAHAGVSLSTSSTASSNKTGKVVNKTA
jgi:hypothetical protein